MAKLSVKYKCGDKVDCAGIGGKVTAIFIRGRGRAYEFSYLNNDGNPSCVTAQECELTDSKPRKLGFNGKR